MNAFGGALKMPGVVRDMDNSLHQRSRKFATIFAAMIVMSPFFYG